MLFSYCCCCLPLAGRFADRLCRFLAAVVLFITSSHFIMLDEALLQLLVLLLLLKFSSQPRIMDVMVSGCSLAVSATMAVAAGRCDDDVDDDDEYAELESG